MSIIGEAVSHGFREKSESLGQRLAVLTLDLYRESVCHMYINSQSSLQ